MTEREALLSALAERERMLRQEQTASAHAQTLLRAIDVLHGNEVPEDGIAHVLKICAEALQAELAVLLRRDTAGAMATRLCSDAGFGFPQWQITAAFAGAPRRVADISAVPDLACLPEQARGFRSLLSAPVNSGDEPQMLLMALSSAAATFSRQDLTLLQRLAAMLERALERLRLAHSNAALARIIHGGTAQRVAPLFPDTSFDALNRAFAHIVDWQGEIVSITNELLNARSRSIDATIQHALARTGQLAGSDRTYVFRLRPPDRLDNTHEWVADGIDPMITQLQDMPDSLLEEWRAELAAARHIYIPDVDAMPAESTVREVLQMQGIRSLLAVPMLQDDTLTGFVGYDAVRTHRRFLPAEIGLLHSVANAIGAVLDRASAEARSQDAQQRLREERNRIEATLAAIPDLVLDLDRDGRFLGHRAGALVTPALPVDKLIGFRPEDVLRADLARLMRQMISEVDARGHAAGYQYQMEIAGEDRWFEASATPKGMRNCPDGYVFVVRDITETRRQQRQITRLGSIAELTSNLVILTDAKGRIDWVNPAFEKRSGWRLSEVRGRKPGDFLRSERADPETVARISQAVQHGKPVQAELVNRTRWGKDYWVSKDIQPLLDRNGHLDGFVSVQTDITALHETHAREMRVLAMAMEASNEGIAISNAEGFYLYMNPAHRRMFAIGPEVDISKLSWQDLTTPQAAARFMSYEWPKLRETGAWSGETSGLRLDGGTIGLETALSLTEDGGLLCIARDASEKRAMELERHRLREDLQLAQRREVVSSIASGVAHDLNNLIAVVSGTVALLQDEHADNPEICTGLARISRAMGTARNLVDGLGQIGRPSAPQCRQDLREIVTASLELLGAARVRQHAIHVDLPASEQPVWANRTELFQVVVNLAINACEAATDRHSIVTIEVSEGAARDLSHAPDVGEFDPRTRYSVFRVVDTGDGVDPQVRNRLFERYVTTKGSAGTGMGLAIVAAILRKNRAALWCHTAQGEGTSMTVAWPCDPEKPGVRTSATPSSDSADSLAGRRILVVDDMPDVADVLAEMLETDDAVVVSVSDPAEALALLSDNPGLWSVLVTDLDMPGRNGVDLARAASRLDPAVPCVLVTALPDSIGANRQFFHEVLAKPIDASSLIAAVRAAVTAQPG